MRVSYRGRKGSVTGKKVNGSYIVTFDDGISRKSGYAPSVLLVLDSNDNEILMTEEEYQEGKSVAKQRGKLPGYERPFEYTKELLFIEPENREGTRVSFLGRKGSVTGKVNSFSIVTFDDDGNNTRESGYPPSELLVLDSNDKEIPMTEEEYQEGKSVAIQRRQNGRFRPKIDRPNLLVKKNGFPTIPYQIKIYFYSANRVAEQQAREGKIEWKVVVTLFQVARFFRSNNTFDAVFSTEGDKRLEGTRTQHLQLPDYDAVLKTVAFLQDESNNKEILAGMVEEMEGLTVKVTADMLTMNRGFYFIVGPLKEVTNALRYEESFPEIEDETCKVVKSGAVFNVKKGGKLIDRRYWKGTENKCQHFKEAKINASAGFAYFAEGVVHMIIEKELNNHFRESDGTHMVGAHSEALMVKTGSGDEEYLRRLGIFWDTALKKAVGEGFNCHSEQV